VLEPAAAEVLSTRGGFVKVPLVLGRAEEN
jgi:hypothetical protein